MATLMQASDCFKGIGKIKAQKILDEMDDEDLCSFCQGWYINHEPDVQSEDFKKLSYNCTKLIVRVFSIYGLFRGKLKIPSNCPQRPLCWKVNVKVCPSVYQDFEIVILKK